MDNNTSQEEFQTCGFIQSDPKLVFSEIGVRIGILGW